MKQEIKHFGIPGMKWGVRRNRKGSSARTSRESSDSKRARSLKKKKVSELSNDELRKLNDRLQLEKNYKSLTKKDTRPGLKFAGSVLSEVGKQIAVKYVKGFAEDAIRNISWAINPELIPDK